MDKRTLTALKESIAKWEKNAQAEGIRGMKLSSDECPLCLLFLDRSDCDGCPVAERTELRFCEGTPYDYFAYTMMYDDAEALSAARREAEFLKSLLPEGERA